MNEDYYFSAPTTTAMRTKYSANTSNNELMFQYMFQR